MVSVMKAMVIRRTGGPEVFEQAELPIPQPGANQVLVKVKATSVNPIDCKVRSGAVAILPPFPAVLHGDISGTVVGVGQDVYHFHEGDEVFGFVGWTGGEGGALAEYAVCDAQLLSHAPRSLPLEEAAALPVIALTAYQGLRRKIRLGKDTLVLVQGGAGGVGHVVVQMAKAFGAEVAATASSDEKIAVVVSSGADWTIRYDQEDVKHYVGRITDGKGFDVVFDTAGGANLPKSFEAARMGGDVVTIAARATVDLSLMHSKGLNLYVVFSLLPILTREGRDVIGQDLAAIARLVDDGHLRPIIYPKAFTLDTIAEAHRFLETQSHYGKILVRVG
ncbi:Bifunctional protein: zinc-containing alcohol dehydrogenase quinone oxidoreductase (NADPH:quinone reductase) Similar to arginate lyase [uncultured spirochete]|uniref:Bifunctional protein: zinc-containing alcohol dehydrogenase quinone oxidoreductase (NADPH:quinone reductase) Similar to arginate lyase n=1 Tax=uncultured spirochete TaxID=156406 RepID=A0A3P3XQS7_9SPIR|nr:Bifunctional protein: zinc-containing alcohol dehydrogenase quinone oxidoreductase (NADPH:quinone reductase) Similar to arginate lyase [uncultured spirochete]